MPVVMLLAVAAVLVCVFFVATGWGGEMSYERPDHAPLDLGPVSATDVALMRPPTALWGYNMQVTDEALEHIARALRDRDITIATLQQQLAESGRQEHPALAPPEPRPIPQATQPAETMPSAEVRLPPYLRQPSDTREPSDPDQPSDPGRPFDLGRPFEPGQYPESSQYPESGQYPESDYSPGSAATRSETPPTRPDLLPAYPEAFPTVESFSLPEADRPAGLPPAAEFSPSSTAREPAEESAPADVVPAADSSLAESPLPMDEVAAVESAPEEAVPRGDALPTAESPLAGDAVSPVKPAPSPEIGQTSTRPATRFFLKASPPTKAPQVPEHTGTSPAADISQNPQVAPPLSAPPAVEATQPATLSTQPDDEPSSQRDHEPGPRADDVPGPRADDVPGPQGLYDAHGWWAEQQRAARAEQAADDPSSDVDPPTADDSPELAGGSSELAGAPDDEALAAAEEQGW